MSNQSTFAKVLAEYKGLTDAELSEQLAYAKHMKANFQEMISAIYAIQQKRREVPLTSHAPEATVPPEVGFSH